MPRRAEPALILGNGPSLRGIDLPTQVQEFRTFGMNAAYRHWYAVGWWPQYYSCLDLVVGLAHKNAIRQMIEESSRIGIETFLLRRNLINELGLEGSPRIHDYDQLVDLGGLPYLADVTTGSHTLLWAQYLGYQVILLAGVDCDYVEQVEGSRLDQGALVIDEVAKENPNYYFDGYQAVGDRYNLPNPRPELHISSWKNAGRFLLPHVRVINTYGGSKVDTFVKLNTKTSTVDPVKRSWIMPAAASLQNFQCRPRPGFDLARAADLFRPKDLSTTAETWLDVLQHQCAQFVTIELESSGSVRVSTLPASTDCTDQQVIPIGGAVCREALDFGIRVLTRDFLQPSWHSRARAAISRTITDALPKRIRKMSLRDNLAQLAHVYSSPRGFALWLLGIAMLLLLRGEFDMQWLACTALYSLWLPLMLRRGA